MKYDEIAAFVGKKIIWEESCIISEGRIIKFSPSKMHVKMCYRDKSANCNRWKALDEIKHIEEMTEFWEKVFEWVAE